MPVQIGKLIYQDFWKVQSDSDPNKFYTVGKTADGRWGCNCIGWCRHVPREDCRHIVYAKQGLADSYDPLLRNMALTTARHERSLQPKSAVTIERKKSYGRKPLIKSRTENRSTHPGDEENVQRFQAKVLGCACSLRVTVEAEANHRSEQVGRSPNPDEQLYSGTGEGI